MNDQAPVIEISAEEGRYLVRVTTFTAAADDPIEMMDPASQFYGFIAVHDARTRELQGIDSYEWRLDAADQVRKLLGFLDTLPDFVIPSTAELSLQTAAKQTRDKQRV